MILLSLLCVLLSVLSAALAFQNYEMKKAAKEIARALSEKLNHDTNTLICLATEEKNMCRLADSLNLQLVELRKQRNRFAQGDLALKNAVTNISHDLRTPLTAIGSYLDLLEQMPKSESVSRCLDVIRNRTEAMGQLTEELLQYTVASSPDNQKRPVDVSLNRVLEENILAFFAAFQEKGITPEIHIPETPVTRRADPGGLSRVFSNILSNAIRYSDGDLEIRLTENGYITFSNTASGMDAVQAERLFHRFYTVADGKKSTGLGLSIAQTLTEQMGGTISAEYNGGKLRIQLYLPNTGEERSI